MIPQACITAWRSVAPWPDDAQVEQDLVLSRAVVTLFADADVSEKIALRGGTALYKLFVTPAVRYSEDIDLVQTQAAPAGPLIDAVRAALDSWLGKPTRDRAEGGFSLIYRFDSEIPPVRPLRLRLRSIRGSISPSRVFSSFRWRSRTPGSRARRGSAHTISTS